MTEDSTRFQQQSGQKLITSWCQQNVCHTRYCYCRRSVRLSHLCITVTQALCGCPNRHQYVPCLSVGPSVPCRLLSYSKTKQVQETEIGANHRSIYE